MIVHIFRKSGVIIALNNNRLKWES